MHRRQVILGGAVLAAWPVLSHAQEADVFDAAGYRRARYRGPVTLLPKPARRIALADALTLRPGENALFLDVLPAEGGVRDPATGHWTLAEPHETIPGARWFPDVGRAPVDQVLWAAFAEAVRARPAHWPVVVFCRADCWMSWNAARRLALAGVLNVWWLAEGIEGWHDAARPLVPVTPEAAPNTGSS